MLIQEYLYTEDPASKRFVPTEGRAGFRLNLWLNNPVAGPADGQPIEVVITDFSFSPPCRDLFMRGDINDDGSLDVVDATFLLFHLFMMGEPPGCDDAADVNDDGLLDSADVISLLNFLFSGQNPPPPPFGNFTPAFLRV